MLRRALLAASASTRLRRLITTAAQTRAIVARYPAILRSRFKGSSIGWVRALTSTHAPPNQAGLLWATTDATRLVPLRWRRE